MSSFSRLLQVLFLFCVVIAPSSAFVVPHGQRSTTTKAWGMASRQSSMRMQAAVLDRSETLERTTIRRRVEEPVKERKQQGNEAWEVRIYNDGLNTREHVARSLVQVTGMAEVNAYQTMMHAHQNGIAVVGRWVFEVAEMYHEQLKTNGIVSDIVPVDEEQ